MKRKLIGLRRKFLIDMKKFIFKSLFARIKKVHGLVSFMYGLLLWKSVFQEPSHEICREAKTSSTVGGCLLLKHAVHLTRRQTRSSKVWPPTTTFPFTVGRHVKIIFIFCFLGPSRRLIFPFVSIGLCDSVVSTGTNQPWQSRDDQSSAISRSTSSDSELAYFGAKLRQLTSLLPCNTRRLWLRSTPLSVDGSQKEEENPWWVSSYASICQLLHVCLVVDVKT